MGRWFFLRKELRYIDAFPKKVLTTQTNLRHHPDVRTLYLRNRELTLPAPNLPAAAHPGIRRYPPKMRGSCGSDLPFVPLPASTTHNFSCK